MKKPLFAVAALAALVASGGGGAPMAAWADVKLVSEVKVAGIPAEAQGAGVGMPQSTSTTAYYKGDKVRTEVKNGPVTIFDAATDKFYTLDPAKKTYTVVGAGEMMNPAASNPMLAMLKFEATADVKDGGATKTLAGKEAKNYLVTSTVNMSMEGAPPGLLPTMKISSEVWTTESIAVPPGYTKMAATAATRAVGPMAKGMKPLTDKLASLKGMPLLTKQTMTFISEQALPGLPKEPIVTTTEVLSISEDELPDSLFAIPADFKKIDPAAPATPAADPAPAKPAPVKKAPAAKPKPKK